MPPTALICQYFYLFSVGNTEEFQKILKLSTLVVIHLYCMGKYHIFQENTEFTPKILKMGEIYTDSKVCWLEALGTDVCFSSLAQEA